MMLRLGLYLVLSLTVLIPDLLIPILRLLLVLGLLHLHLPYMHLHLHLLLVRILV